jgi:hypothetical protein
MFKPQPALLRSLFILLLSCAIIQGMGFSVIAKEEELWQVKKSSHFQVRYRTQESGEYVELLLKFAEDYYTSITESLGFRRFDFWTWDRACTIDLYSSHQEYYEVTKQPAWSGAVAYVRERMIKTFLYKKDFLETILPHEMAHLIFREFVGYRTPLPLWLDEGIACLQEKNNLKSYMLVARVLIKSSVFIPLEKLTEIQREGLVMQDVFYAEAASVAYFLLENYGKDKFIDYCRKLRDGKNWQISLLEIYGLKDLSQMNAEWVKFIAKH